MNKEPALLVGIFTAVLSLLVVFGVLDEKQSAAVLAVIVAAAPILQGIVTRQFVFSPHTIKEAGLNPEDVVERAQDPAVVPYRKSGGLS